MGYPLALWPACPPHIFQMCAVRDIHTVEQLAQIVCKKRRAEAVKTIPPDIVEIADRAVKMMELHGKAGQYEAIVTDLAGPARRHERAVRRGDHHHRRAEDPD